MTARVLPRWLPLLLLAGGCFTGDGKPKLVSGDPFNVSRLPEATQVAHSPATEETARQVAVAAAVSA